MVQSVLNSYCLTSRQCCFCIGLKLGTALIALAGLIPSLFLIGLYAFGKEYIEENGVLPLLSDVLLHIYAVVGILLFAVSIILLVAALTYNEKLILLYLWYIVIYFIVDFFCITLLCFSAILSGNLLFGLMIFVLDIMYWCTIYYILLPVVNGYRKNIHTVVIYLA